MHHPPVDFTWDEPKRLANLAKHGLDFADAEKVFDGPIVLFEDDRFDYLEQRMIGVGLLDDLVVPIVHVESDETIRIISMRTASLSHDTSSMERAALSRQPGLTGVRRVTRIESV